MGDYLLPKLEEYRNYLLSAGADAQLSMDDKERPGLFVTFEGIRGVFVTFIEGSAEAPEIMRIAAETAMGDEALSPGDLSYVNLLVEAAEVDSPDKLKKFIRLLLSGKSLEVYPTAEQLTADDERTASAEGFYPDEISEGDAADADLSSEELAGVDLSDSGMMLLPRVNALTAALLREGADDAQAGIAGTAFTIVADEDFAFVAAFENISDNEYLLHFRTDIPYDEDEQEEMEQLVKSFNDKSLFTRCCLGQRDLGLFDDEEPLVMTFHAVTVDSGPIRDDSFYGFFASLFEYEVRQLIDELTDGEDE
ncbi:MAG: hypothetical protein K6E91_04140 [Butyrivibrio sp.]|nr:hypothetical protein [Butyrivibrio sp.]